MLGQSRILRGCSFKSNNNSCKTWCINTFETSITVVISGESYSIKHYSVFIMTTMASQITGVSIVCSTVCSGADQRNHQSSASLAFSSKRASHAENVSIWWSHHYHCYYLNIYAMKSIKPHIEADALEFCCYLSQHLLNFMPSAFTFYSRVTESLLQDSEMTRLVQPL